MGDTLDESPPTRRDKPQTLNISPEEAETATESLTENETETEASISSVPSSSSAMHYARNRTRCERERERERERDHSSDGLMEMKRNEEFVGLVTPPRRESLNSCDPQQQQQQQTQASSPGGFSNSLNKALGLNNRVNTTATTSSSSSSTNTGRYSSSSIVVGGGVGNLPGTTTRKCVLTLDGYSYVIVASTPETLPNKREEANAGGSGGSNNSAGGGGGAASGGTSGTVVGSSGSGGGGATATSVSNNGEQSPTSCDLGGNATINGQVAKHGSLTIVRRSNSRKNFTNIDSQTQSIASPSSANISFFQTPLSESLAERLSGRGSNGSSATTATATTTSSSTTTAASGTNSAGKMQPSSPNQTNFVTDNIQVARPTDRQTYDLRLSRDTIEYPNSISVGPPGSVSNPGYDQSSDHSVDTGSNLSVSGIWETDNLPPVDTPDALNKAAIRIRSLLRRMDHETVAYEDMQRNLHYAARVLEAVFIDESRSPTSGKSKLGQIASSSVESEDEPAKQRCNDGNCKNINNNNSSLRDEQTSQSSANASDNQTSIVSRTKGVSLAPQTHSGPTGPPAEGETEMATKALETVTESAQEEHTTETTTATTTTTTTTATTTTTKAGSEEGQSVSSSSSCSNKATVQRQRRLRTPVWARSMSTNKTSHVKENHGANIFGVTFNTLLGKDEPQVFATAGSNRCTIYECPKKGGLTLLHCYADPDPDEVFYTCAWSYDLKTSAPLLAAAGYRGVIRVIDIEQNEAVGNYIGHGQAINELKFHPHKLQLLLSGSKDHAIRLWNIQSHVCIAIFGGVEGHRDEVLSIDFNMRGDRIVSSGMDHSLKLWCLNTQEFQHKIELSHTFSQEKSTLPFPTITKHFPDFSTRDIHRNYVDCVQWFGNFVLSKSCENAIVCWKPGQLHQSFVQLKPSDSSCTIIAEFEYDECEIWFVRFGFNPWQKVIALGNQQGKVYVWEMDPSDPEGAHMTTLHNPRSVATVRQIAFSRDASVLIYVCDDATVWRWNRRNAAAL